MTLEARPLPRPTASFLEHSPAELMQVSSPLNGVNSYRRLGIHAILGAAREPLDAAAIVAQWEAVAELSQPLSKTGRDKARVQLGELLSDLNGGIIEGTAPKSQQARHYTHSPAGRQLFGLSGLMAAWWFGDDQAAARRLLPPAITHPTYYDQRLVVLQSCFRHATTAEIAQQTGHGRAYASLLLRRLVQKGILTSDTYKCEAYYRIARDLAPTVRRMLNAAHSLANPAFMSGLEAYTRDLIDAPDIFPRVAHLAITGKPDVNSV